MSLEVAGADRFLNGVVGAVVAAGTSLTAKLHTADPPTADNELSGGGYSDVELTTGGFARATVGGYRALQFPLMEFFSDATSLAQTSGSIGFWHAAVLIWSRSAVIVPRNDRVFTPDKGVQIRIQMDGAGLVLTNAGLDRGLRTLAGEAAAARPNMFWELHSGATPSAANRLTGGGIDGIPDVAWGLVTSGDWRRIRQTALLDFGVQTADANAAPQSLGLWDGRPEANPAGTLIAYRELTGIDQPRDGDAVTIDANELYFGLNMVGEEITV